MASHLQVRVDIRRAGAQLLQAPLFRLLQAAPLERLRVRVRRRGRRLRSVNFLKVLHKRTPWARVSTPHTMTGHDYHSARRQGVLT